MQNQTVKKASINSQTDRRLIPADQDSERYILLTLQIPDTPRRTDRLPLNLSLIIDRSGSMSGHKLEYVKEAASHALRLLTETDRVSVVIYDDEVELLSPSRTLTPTARDDMIQRIRQVRTGGMTNLSGGWFTGCDQIADYMTSDYLNRALLLTDGLANRGKTDPEELVMAAKELRRRGISTTTFGVGHDFNQFLLQGIADGGGGHFYFIDKPDQIPNYFQGELGELLATVAREITLEINTPADIDIELLNDFPHERLQHNLRIFLGDAYAGEVRNLVLKLKLPGYPMGQKLVLPLTLRYEDVQQRRIVSIESEAISFTIASQSACQTQPVNEHVLDEAGRMTTEKAKMEALKKEYEGDIAGAKAVLRRAGNTLHKVVSTSTAKKLSTELTEMADEMTEGLTEEVRKAQHYATYQVQRSRRDYKK